MSGDTLTWIGIGATVFFGVLGLVFIGKKVMKRESQRTKITISGSSVGGDVVGRDKGS